MSEVLTHDPILAAWKNINAARPDLLAIGALKPTPGRDVDNAIAFAVAVSNYVFAIMMTPPQDGDKLN